VHLTASRIRIFLYAFTVWHLGSWMLLATLGSARLLTRLARLLTRKPPETTPLDPSRRRLLGAGMAAAAVGAAGFAGILVKRTRDVHVAERNIVLKRLPKKLDGTVLVQMSDLHVGVFLTQRELERVVHQANDLGADYVLMTGDLVDNAPVFIPAL